MTIVQSWHQHLVDRALADPAFRDGLIKEPHRAIEETTGYTVPANLEVLVHENTGNKLHIVLPFEPSSFAAQAVSEESAAGTTNGCCTTTVKGATCY